MNKSVAKTLLLDSLELRKCFLCEQNQANFKKIMACRCKVIVCVYCLFKDEIELHFYKCLRLDHIKQKRKMKIDDIWFKLIKLESKL